MSKNKVFITAKEQFNSYIKDTNGIIDCYSSIYQIRKEEYVITIDNRRKRIYRSVIIDKMFYDLDNFGSCWSTTIKVHKRLIEENITHTITLSGGGFHLYVITEPFMLELLNDESPKTENRLKATLKNAQHGIINIINSKLDNGSKITIGKPKSCDMDYHVIGDISRIARIPNTWHPSRKRFAIPIHTEDFNLSFDELLSKAQSQQQGLCLWGNKKVNLEDYDKTIILPPDYELNDITPTNIDVSSSISLLPQFIQNLLTSREDGHRARYLTQVSMKVRGFPKSLAEQICKQYWYKNKYIHAICGHGYNSFDYIWSRNDLFFPNWKTLEDEGWKIPKEDYNYKEMYNR